MSTKKATRQAIWIFWIIILALILGTIVLNGISLVPYSLYQRLSQNPFITRTDIGAENFWQETLLLPLIAFYTNWYTPFAFNILCFVILLIAYLLFSGLSFRRFGFTHALIFTFMLSTLPVTTVLFSWVGSPDGVTFLFTIPLLFTNSVLLIFLLSAFSVTNHVAFIIGALEILVLRWLAKDKIGTIQIASAIGGGVCGYVLLKLFFAINHIHVLSRLKYMLDKDLNTWVTINRSNFPLTFLSLMGIQWLILPICTFLFFKRDKRFFIITWMILLLNYTITFFTLDTTRVFSLLSWGIMMYCLFHCYHLSKEDNNINKVAPHRFTTLISIPNWIAFLLPRFYSWEGNIYLSPFFDNLWHIFK